jgi:uncharacterized protein YjbI with pentapeptide repeats/N-acetylneuraminic acid mutarotase
MKYIGQMLLLMLWMVVTTQAVPPVLNYAGQVAVDGEVFDGNGLFKFALVNSDGTTTYWSNDGSSVNGSEPQASVSVPVNGGLYSLLLGNTAQQGMGAIDPAVFAQHTDAKLRVWFSDGVNGFQQLSPDRPFASVPYAFSAGTAQSATIADGSINRAMLGSDVLTDLNAPIGMNRLSTEVTEKLNQEKTTTNNYNAPSVGSLLAVPYGSDAPTGYSLYQQSEQSWNWQEMSPHPGEGRWVSDGVVEVEGEIYLVAGYGTSRKDTLLKFNPQTDKWVSLAPLDFARDRVASAVLNGRIYLIGGYDGTSKLKHVDVYDPATNSWNSAADLPEAIERSTAESFNGKIYLLGGTGDKVYSYDPSINIWSEEANMTKNINGGSSCIFNGRIWLAKEKDALSYDPILKEWKTETSFNLNKGQPAMWTYEGNLYAGGGPQNDLVEKFSIETQQWENHGKLPYMVSNAKAFVVQHHLYLVSGDVNPTGLSNKVFVVDLDQPTNGVYDLYRKDGDAPVGTPVVQSEYADGSVTASKMAEGSVSKSALDATILKYLKPEITSQPQAQTVYADTNATFSVTAEGKFLTYQWKKDGVDLTGETNATLNIKDANATMHDGNYSVVVSNDFGSVSSDKISLLISIAYSIDYRGQNLVGGNFNSKDLRFADFRDSNLSGADFWGANLEGANFSNADLSGANFRRSTVDGAVFEKANLNRSRFTWVDMSNVDLDSMDIEGVWFDEATTWPLEFNPLDHGALGPHADLRGVDFGFIPYNFFEDVDLSHAKVSNLDLSGKSFFLGTFINTDFSDSNLSETKFRRANLSNSNLTNADFSNADLSSVNLSGAILVNTILRDAWFDRETKWPDNFNPLLKGAKGPGKDFTNIDLTSLPNGYFTKAQSADFSYANFSNGDLASRNFYLTDLIEANFTNSNLENSTFRRADLTKAIFQSANLSNSNLTGTKLTGTNFVDSNLTNAALDENHNLSGATYSLKTVWPANFDPIAAGALLLTTTKIDLNATVAMDMIWCPPGTFTMGSPSEEVGRRADREDEHNVTLTQGFYLGKYEVTQAQYEAITGLNPSEFSGVSKKNRPVEKLRWAEAVAFCNQLTLQERNADLIPSDWEYVLPTESQWEYACRAGSTKAYSWGDVIASTNANYGNIIGQTSNVGNYAANPWGFFDMNGNVWEFTADAFLANYPTGSLVIDPTNPGTTGSRRVRRGGSWSSQQSELRSSERGHGDPSNRFNDLGFRVSLQKSQ